MKFKSENCIIGGVVIIIKKYITITPILYNKIKKIYNNLYSIRLMGFLLVS